MAKKIGILGSGIVGQTLADGFIKHGYQVMRGSREPQKLADWKTKAGPNADIGTFQQAVQFSDILILAVKGSVAEDLVKSLATHLSGKTILDACNPIADEPPINGVLKFFTGPNDSLLERLQMIAPGAHFVKCFSCVGNAFMVNPKFKEGRPSMFICGRDESSKAEVRKILDQFGWDTEDMGGAEAARAIEPLCMLWCIPGLRSNKWNHAFKLLHL